MDNFIFCAVMVQTLFCLCLEHPKLFPFAVCFDTLVINLKAVLFYLWTDETEET